MITGKGGMLLGEAIVLNKTLAVLDISNNLLGRGSEDCGAFLIKAFNN